MILNLDTSLGPQSIPLKKSNTIKGSWKKKHVINKIKSASKNEKKIPFNQLTDQPKDIKDPKEKPNPQIKKSTNAMPMDKNFSSSLFTHSTRLNETDQHSKLPIPLAENPFSSQSFHDLGLNAELSQHLLTKLGLESPTKIQSEAIPAFFNSCQDLIIKAQTGSGKSFSFLLPIIHSLLEMKNMSRQIGTMAIALVPTRELAMQLESVLKSILSFKSQHKGHHWIVQGLVIGGEKRKSEKARLRKGVTILVSTPGRLLDHLSSTSCFDVSKLYFFLFSFPKTPVKIDNGLCWTKQIRCWN